MNSDCGHGNAGHGQNEAAGGTCPYGPSDARCKSGDPWAEYVPDSVDGPRTVADAYAEFIDTLSAGPLGPVLNYQGSDGGSGDCPTIGIPASKYWGGIDVTSHCEVFDAASPVLYVVMTWAWPFLGLHILLR